jgi:hypothetical protein
VIYFSTGNGINGASLKIKLGALGVFFGGVDVRRISRRRVRCQETSDVQR